VKLDFFHNGYRYRCLKPDPSIFLATYDLLGTSGLDEEQYGRIREDSSARESHMFDERLDLLDRRVYTHVSSLGKADGPAPVIMVVAFVLKNDLVRWYEDVNDEAFSADPTHSQIRAY
jgi:hypothetical protein